MGSARSATAVTPLEALRPIELTDNHRSSLTRAIIGILMVVVGIAMAIFSICQNVSFELVKGGYVIAQVDAALARLFSCQELQNFRRVLPNNH